MMQGSAGMGGPDRASSNWKPGVSQKGKTSLVTLPRKVTKQQSLAGNREFRNRPTER